MDYSDVVSLVTQQIGYPATMKYIWHHCSKTFIKECLAFDIFFIFYFQFFISQLSDDNSSRINSLNIKEKIEKLKYRKNSYTLLLVGEIISYSKSESFEIRNKKFELSDLSENFFNVVIAVYIWKFLKFYFFLDETYKYEYLQLRAEQVI